MKTAKAFLSAATLAAVPLILYAPFLFGGKVLYWGVYLLQFYPWRQLAVEQVRAGHWPLWNPYLGAGTPLAANLQTAAFYPPHILFLLMPVERAFGWELALHLALAALSAYYLGRTLGMSRFASLITGLTYGGGGYLVARWVFPSMVSSAAWLPLLLAFTERLVQRSVVSDRRAAVGGDALAEHDPQPATHYTFYIGLLALVIALQLLAGHAQTSFYSALIVAAFALSRLAHHISRVTHDASHLTDHPSRMPPHVSRCAARTLVALVLAGLLGVTLAAIQLLPTAEFVAHSQRAGTLTDLTFAYELSFWPWRLISLLAPDFFGNPARNEYWAYGTYWEEAAYVGILPLLLAALAVVAWWRMRRLPKGGPISVVPFFSVLCLLSVVLALGDHTPLYPLLFRYVPGFGLFQAPARLMIGYALGVALLAGIGAENLRLSRRTKSVLRIAVAAGLGIAIAGAITRLALPGLRTSFGESILRLGLTLSLAAGLLLLRERHLGARRWKAVVVAFVAVDLLAFGWGLAPSTDPSVYHAPVAMAEFLHDQMPGRLHVLQPRARQIYGQYVSRTDFGSVDPAHVQGLRDSLIPNLNSPHHLPGVGNYDPLTVGPYHDLYSALEGKRDAPPAPDDIRPVLNLFGARYLITSDELELPLLYGAGPRIYANDGALPAAWVVSQARVIEDGETRLEALLDPDFDPRAEVLLSYPPPEPEPWGKVPPDPLAQAQPIVLRERPDRVIIQVSMTAAGYLVFADTYYPGWRALVDDQPAEILPANHAFRAVALGAGEHTVMFEYAPLSFRLGACLTLGAALLLVTTLWFTMIRRRSWSIQNWGPW